MLVLRHVCETHSLLEMPLTMLRPDGEFLIDYHPQHENLFVATGGSGHGFKFFPIIGEKIVDAIERRLEPDLHNLWQWSKSVQPDFDGCNDGSRSGRRGMILEEEMARSGKP